MACNNWMTLLQTVQNQMMGENQAAMPGLN
jgi:hypothetical protein